MSENSQWKDVATYRGPASILWGSWRIEGEAAFTPAKPGDEASGIAGSFTAHSETEPILLSTLASALRESYSLRLGEEDDHMEPMDIALLAHDGHRIDFVLRP